MNKKYRIFIAVTLIVVVALTSLTVGAITVSAPKPPEVKQITSQNYTTSSLTKATLVTAKGNKKNKVHKNKTKIQKVVETTTTVPKKKKKKKKITPSTTISTTSPIETTAVEENEPVINNNYSIDTDLLAKLLYCEGGSMSDQGQIYVCSAILNFLDAEGVDLYTAAHNPNMFAVASYVDSASPSDYQYNIINRVLNGERVEGVKYFQVGSYHSFGTPVCSIDNVYFSA